MSLFSLYKVLSYAFVQFCIAAFISYYLSTNALERDSENFKNMYFTVMYGTVRGDNSLMGTGLR